jgi:hypothetical protein
VGKQYVKIQNERYKPIRNARNRERRKNDPAYALRERIRCRIYQALKKQGISRKGKNKYLGMTIETYKKWLEYQFEDGMTWENHGKYWHIDHARPCDSFKFINENDDAIYECFNWKNTRPMVGSENIKKGSTVDEVVIKNHKKNS